MSDPKYVDGLTPKTVSQVMQTFQLLHASGKMEDVVRELEDHGVHLYVEHDKLQKLGEVLGRVSAEVESERNSAALAAGRPGVEPIWVPC